jgi:hypothetical protein
MERLRKSRNPIRATKPPGRWLLSTAKTPDRETANGPVKSGPSREKVPWRCSTVSPPKCSTASWQGTKLLRAVPTGERDVRTGINEAWSGRTGDPKDAWRAPVDTCSYLHASLLLFLVSSARFAEFLGVKKSSFSKSSFSKSSSQP